MVGRLAELLSVRPFSVAPSSSLCGDVWEVEGVRVRYRAEDSLALDSVSLRLEPGRSVALVGASGSGKTTLLALLSRNVEPSGGRVTLDGVDIRGYDGDEVRLQISGLFQDAHVFAATIAANLRLAAPDACDDMLRDASRRAGLLSWIESLPQGWETLLGDDGALMSGGQRKRLLLARALLADRPVLLLDEPTEGLDPALADEVMAGVLAAYGDRALCVATHRLTGLEAFDEIVVLDAGRVVERGTHRELVSRPGFYRALWSAERLAGAAAL
jgi:ABC-type transport system involved in cytochrome bd biosynthesis fused ATPase/permease subunit